MRPSRFFIEYRLTFTAFQFLAFLNVCPFSINSGRSNDLFANANSGLAPNLTSIYGERFKNWTTNILQTGALTAQL